MQILRRGSEGDDVRRWQAFLRGRELLEVVDGLFGSKSEQATRAYQKSRKIEVDGQVGPRTYGTALLDGFDPGFTDPLGGTSGADWPPPPTFGALVTNAEREQVFGKFEYTPVPGSDDIKIKGNWVAKNIVAITIPQLAGVKGGPKSGRVAVHRLAAAQLTRLFEAWEQDGLISLIKTWDGLFAPRFVRGSKTNLSNHAWGTGFDVNYAWNHLGALPALRSQPGSVRELVPRANELGFYWGGHFSRRDGMHFEVARLLG